MERRVINCRPLFSLGWSITHNMWWWDYLAPNSPFVNIGNAYQLTLTWFLIFRWLFLRPKKVDRLHSISTPLAWEKSVLEVRLKFGQLNAKLNFDYNFKAHTPLTIIVEYSPTKESTFWLGFQFLPVRWLKKGPQYQFQHGRWTSRTHWLWYQTENMQMLPWRTWTKPKMAETLGIISSLFPESFYFYSYQCSCAVLTSQCFFQELG